MADKSWTKNHHALETHNIYHGYEQWKKGHKRLQERTDTPKTGRDYVEDAISLVNLLEGFSELNPISKTVVSLFKTVVTLELNRRENDAHIDIVFLAMADMMSTLLDTSQFSETLSKRTKDGHLSMADKLRVAFAEIENDITACGNSMDTYSKESQIRRFLKSSEWKSRITSQIETFSNHRVKLQQILALQTASDVNSLVDVTAHIDANMNLLISHIFAPNSDWEKAAAKKARRFSKVKDGKNLANNHEYLEALIQDSESNHSGTSGDKSAIIDQLQKELRLSVVDACKENKESFERKLNYYSEQLEKSMKTNADYIVKKLSGPYDRLNHKDLKSLWKKMKWIFCIDNVHFTSALFEYYLDHFSSVKVIKDGQVEFDDEESSDERTIEENMTIIKDLSDRGALNHPDKWTLIPMAKYKDRIAHAIDSDDSGLIRISEVNAFTDRMPKGWSVPQWCAYAAVGWTYQARCYRKRINYILSRMHEQQAKVLPANRDLVMATNRAVIPFYQLLALEPWETPYAKYPIPDSIELRDRVFDKIKTEDKEMSSILNEIQWNVEDETSMQMISPGEKPLETYVLQLGVLLLEHMYQVMQTFSKVTEVNDGEVAYLTKSLQYLRQMCKKRIKDLIATENKTKEHDKDKDYIGHFYGGIWGCIYRASLLKGKITLKQEDIEDFRCDEDLIAEFYQCQTHSTTPEDLRVNANEVASPFTLQQCSLCQKGPGEGYRYVCMELECNTILCSECYARQLPTGPSDHTFAHTVLRFSLDTVENHLSWMMMDARIQKQRIYTQTLDFEWSRVSFWPEDEEEEEEEEEDIEAETGGPFYCGDCKEAILLDDETDTTFYKCFGHSCSEHYLCKGCVDHGANSDGHRWWHSLIVLRSQVILEDLRKMEEEDSDTESTQSDSDEDGIAAVVSKLDATHLMLQGKMDTLLDGQTKFTEERARDTNTVQSADLESKISQLLDNKIGAMLAELRGNGNKDGVSGVLDSRMAQVESRLESLADEMRKHFNPSATSHRALSPPGKEVLSKSDPQEHTGARGNGVEGSNSYQNQNDRRIQDDAKFNSNEDSNNRNQEDARSEGSGVEDIDRNYAQVEDSDDDDNRENGDDRDVDEDRSNDEERGDDGEERGDDGEERGDDGEERGDDGEERGDDDDHGDDAGDRYNRAWPQRSDDVGYDDGNYSIPEDEGDW